MSTTLSTHIAHLHDIVQSHGGLGVGLTKCLATSGFLFDLQLKKMRCENDNELKLDCDLNGGEQMTINGKQLKDSPSVRWSW
jgi:hypothetical protein